MKIEFKVFKILKICTLMAKNNTGTTIHTFKVLPNNIFLVNDIQVSKETLLEDYDLYCGNLVKTEWFLETMKDVIDWERVSFSLYRLSFILKMKDYVRWTTVCIQRKDISEEIIREHLDTINLKYVTYNLSTYFIREFALKLNWEHLLHNRQFTNSELNEFKDYYYDSQSCWYNIARYQKLSDTFILANYEKMYNLERYQKISEDTVLQNKDKFDIGKLIYYNDYSKEFVSLFSKDKDIAKTIQDIKNEEEYYLRNA